LSIAAIADQVGGLDLPDPVTLAPSLKAALAGMVDPRRPRGIARPAPELPNPQHNDGYRD
jgi:hypothetical protein